MASQRDIANRLPITIGLMLATVMTALDGTIANIALPHMQGSFSAAQDQMVWVLTSYIVATAIMTPVTGWLSMRIGRRQMFLISIAGFTVTSMLCGSAATLQEMVLCRLVQGLCGASMIPLSQAVMLDMYPPQQIGQVMAIWGAGTLLGPIFGPLIGGWITQDFSWRWAFYINLPVGLVAFACVWFFMSPDPGKRGRPFDFLGYGALITFIAGLQLALDRGPTQDWFASPEVWTEAICSAIGLYVFIMQTVTARQPFFDRALGLNRNFIFCNLYSVVIGVLLFATMALQPPLMQQLLGYPVLGAGLVMMPRGIGSVISMLIVGRLVGKIDTRLLMVGGLALSALAMLQMSHFDLSMTTTPFITSGLLQGFATGFMFVPMTAMAFATLEPRLRPDATSVFATVRSLGQAVGISIMEAVYTNQAAVAHGDLSAAVQPSNPALAAGLPANLNPLTLGGLEGLNGEVTRQASMVGYVDVFRLMFFGAILVMPMVLVLRPPKSAPVTTEIAVD